MRRFVYLKKLEGIASKRYFFLIQQAAIVISAVITMSVHAAGPATAPCQEKPSDISIFSTVVSAARSLTCNNAGYWEVEFGELQQFIFLPAGVFKMGSDKGLKIEQPVHDVELDGYWIAKYPVTVGQFREFVASTAYVTDAENGWGAWQWTGHIPGPDNSEEDPWVLQKDGHWDNIYFTQSENDPVGSVSWNDANQYASWLSDQLALPFVLPTEAQWEKAARSTDGRRFPWGDSKPGGDHANFADSRFAGKYGQYARRVELGVDDRYIETNPVDAFPAGQSPYGVYDLAGNLGEWVYDVFDSDYYSQSPYSNPTGPEVEAGTPDAAVDRVNRGGSWVDRAGVDGEGKVLANGGHDIRSAARTGDEQNSSDDHMGFRLALDGRRVAETPPPDPDIPDLTGVVIQTQKAAGQVYMLEATGDVAGNIAVSVGEDGILIVDDQFSALAPAIDAALKALKKGTLKFIVNTHHHTDHSDGNARLASKHESVIVAHEQTRKRLLSKGPGQWPVVTFDETMSIHFNGERIRLVSIPGGHTDNDIVVFFESSNVVHLGDLMNSGISSFPVADIEAGGNALKILENVTALLPMISDDAIIIPGHGPISNKQELYVLQEMLITTINLIKTKKQNSFPLKEIIEQGLPEKYSEWGYGYMPAEGWIEMIYNSVPEK